MKFVCIECDEPMKFAKNDGLDDDGSLSVNFICPSCEWGVTLLTNPQETQMVRSLGVKIGGSAVPPQADGDAADASGRSACGAGSGNAGARQRLGLPVFSPGAGYVSGARSAGRSAMVRRGDRTPGACAGVHSSHGTGRESRRTPVSRAPPRSRQRSWMRPVNTWACEARGRSGLFLVHVAQQSAPLSGGIPECCNGCRPGLSSRYHCHLRASCRAS